MEQAPDDIEISLSNNRLISGPDIVLQAPERQPEEETDDLALVAEDPEPKKPTITLKSLIKPIPVDIEDIEKPKLVRKRSFTNKVLQASAASVTVIAFFLGAQEAGKYADLVAANEEIRDSQNYVISTEEAAANRQEYQANIDKMAQHKNNVETFNSLMALAIVCEAYLFFFPSYENEVSSNMTGMENSGIRLHLNAGSAPNGAPRFRLSLVKSWLNKNRCSHKTG